MEDVKSICDMMINRKLKPKVDNDPGQPGSKSKYNLLNNCLYCYMKAKIYQTPFYHYQSTFRQDIPANEFFKDYFTSGKLV